MTEALAVLSTALLFGGMTLYAFGFAAVLFTTLPAPLAGATLRNWWLLAQYAAGRRPEDIARLHGGDTLTLEVRP